MKIRIGYVTNSSSTNFLILLKKELTAQYLYKKLGFKKNSPIESAAMEMCENIIYGTNKGLRYFNFDEVTYDNVKEVFGEKAASRYLEYQKKGYLGYMGYTSSDEGTLTSFFTTDSFEIDNNDIYVYARSCMW